MTPRQVIAALDKQLMRHGTPATLLRRIGTTETFASVACRVRFSSGRADTIAGNVKMTDRIFVLSPTDFSGGAWPGAAGRGVDPLQGDFLEVAGKRFKLEHVIPSHIGATIVRYDGRASG